MVIPESRIGKVVPTDYYYGQWPWYKMFIPSLMIYANANEDVESKGRVAGLHLQGETTLWTFYLHAVTGQKCSAESTALKNESFLL